MPLEFIDKPILTMPHAIWKGAISFGLVHVPVALYPASSEAGIDFDWLDRRSMDPVGYRRINKRTGKEIDKSDIVRGVKTQSGDYVVLGDEEIKAAYPKTTQTIEIESFTKASAIAFTLFEKPYYLEPIAKGEKVYALLREAMAALDVVGIARVVLHTKEYLAALIPDGPALILNTLRWSAEMRSIGDYKLPAAGKSGTSLKDAELTMAKQLITTMSEPWHPEAYADKFTAAVHALVEKRVAAGETERVDAMEEGSAAAASNVIDLTELLARSLGKNKATRPTPATAKTPKAAKTPSNRTAVRKRA